MAILKTLLQSEAAQAAIGGIASLYIRLVHATTRWSVVNGRVPRPYWDGGRPFIACLWHSRILMMPYCWERGRPIHMLISAHRDGRLIARTMAHLGIGAVTGSTTRGGAQGLRGLLRLLKAGDCVGITPDGPRGPRMRAAEGAVVLARLSGAPLVPIAYGVTRRRLAGSWDRFVVALPFGRGVFVWGDPIELPCDADAAAIENGRRRLEDALNAVTAEADRLCGHEPVAPAPERAAEARA